MRRENKELNATINSARVQGYHERTDYSSNRESYAFQGFNGDLKYFTSDRFIKTAIIDGILKREDGKILKGYGLEIELECDGICSQKILANVLEKVVFSVFPAGLFKMQQDGSLGGDTNAECITQIMTKEFIRNNYKNFRTFWNDYFPMFGLSTQNNHCGMHCNVSLGVFGTTKKSQDDAVRKLYYIINKHFDFFVVALNRTNGTGYCSKNTDYADARTMDLENMPSSHYVAMNYGHYSAGRIEIRLVGGQKNYACFRNTMETIFHLVDAVKTLSWNDLDDIPKIFSGCNNYVFDRISTNCYRSGVISADDVEKIRGTVKNVELI